MTLKQRKLWVILRKLEGKSNAPASSVVLIDLLLKEGFRDREEAQRTIESMVPEFILHNDYSTGNLLVKGLKTQPSGDKYFAFPYFWNKWLEDIGFLKILGAIATILTFIPNGLAYKIWDDLIHPIIIRILN